MEKFYYLSIFLLLFSCTSEVTENGSGKHDGDPKRELFEKNDFTISFIRTEGQSSAALVFVHGSPGSASAFSDFFEKEILTSEFDIISVDRPGYGGSDSGEAVGSLKIQASRIHSAVSSLGYDEVLLVGHSLGGPVVAKMVIDNPDYYEGLLMIAPSIDPALEKEEWYRGLIQTKIGKLLTPIDFEVSNIEILQLKSELEFLKKEWEYVRIPTIVLHGTKDILVPVENVEFAREVIDSEYLRIVLLEGVNHFIPWTHQDEVVSTILQLKR